MPTITELRDFVKERLGKTFTPKSKDWENVLKMLETHPTWGSRLQEIQGIRFRRGRINNAPQMWLKCARWFIASWQRCGSNYQQPKKRLLGGAMRNAIRAQTRAFSTRARLAGSWRCEVCETIQPKLEVDHFPLKFDVIMKEFLESEPEIPTKFDYSRKTGIPRFQRGNSNFKTRWQRVHKHRATYRLLCRRCNAADNST